MRILVGNCFSFAASVFMSLAAYTDSRRKMLVFQTADCILLAIAQLILGAPSGAVVLMLGALRNLLIIKNKFTLFAMLLFSSLAAVMGTLANERGIIGYIPIAATLVLTVGLYGFKGPVAAKVVILLNLLLWSVYSFMIYDLATGVSNGAAAVICLITLIVKLRELNREKSSGSRDAPNAL